MLGLWCACTSSVGSGWLRCYSGSEVGVEVGSEVEVGIELRPADMASGGIPFADDGMCLVGVGGRIGRGVVLF